jgi:hypothetical protein
MKGASSSCFAITYPLWQPEFGSALLTFDRKELLVRADKAGRGPDVAAGCRQYV